MRDFQLRQVMRRVSLFFPRRAVPILMYHQIARASKDADPFCLVLSPKIFESQMKGLLARGLRSLELDEVALTIGANRKTPDRTFALTFDDGLLNTYTDALAIILDCGFKATVFLISDYVGRRTSTEWWSGSPAALMSWQQAREMSKHGISFQSHTCTHADLTKLDDKSVLRELLDSKKRIEDALGLPVRHLAYPSGSYNERIIQLVQEAGYQAAYAAGLSPGSRFCIERFACNACGWKFRMESCVWSSWLRHIDNLPRAIRHVVRKTHGRKS